MHKATTLLIIILFISCTTKEDKAVALYNIHCAQCHVAPEIGDLPKEIWATEILPDMGSRMGILEEGYDPMNNLSFAEMDAIIKTGIFPARSTISSENWGKLKAYILRMAPDTLEGNTAASPSKILRLFSSNRVSLDSNDRATITYLKFHPKKAKLIIGDLSGDVFQYNFMENSANLIGQFRSSVVDYSFVNEMDYATTIGSLRPSEIPNGRIFIRKNGNTKAIPESFHRPVNTLVEDLNNNGKSEIVVSEFGDLTGQLSILKEDANNNFSKDILLSQPGTIRVLSEDMDMDGKIDLVVLTAQGEEGITILYQQGNLKFKADRVLRFSPVYGSSWFELVDYDNDGDKDIITVHGDNADKSYVSKPYHGMRIHLNEGNNVFKETFFYPMNGATRVLIEDFDQDGDMDFALLSTFPDYKTNTPTFVYLENNNSKNYEFVAQTFKENNLGRWFLMDAGDIDNDGDTDIVLSAFTLSFTKLPSELVELWKEKDADIMVLLNQLH